MKYELDLDEIKLKVIRNLDYIYEKLSAISFESLSKRRHKLYFHNVIENGLNLEIYQQITEDILPILTHYFSNENSSNLQVKEEALHSILDKSINPNTIITQLMNCSDLQESIEKEKKEKIEMEKRENEISEKLKKKLNISYINREKLYLVKENDKDYPLVEELYKIWDNQQRVSYLYITPKNLKNSLQNIILSSLEKSNKMLLSINNALEENALEDNVKIKDRFYVDENLFLDTSKISQKTNKNISLDNTKSQNKFKQ